MGRSVSVDMSAVHKLNQVLSKVLYCCQISLHWCPVQMSKDAYQMEICAKKDRKTMHVCVGREQKTEDIYEDIYGYVLRCSISEKVCVCVCVCSTQAVISLMGCRDLAPHVSDTSPLECVCVCVCVLMLLVFM